MSVLTDAPTEKTLAFVDALLQERSDLTLESIPEDRRPKTQREASAWIEDLQARPALPVTDEQIDRVKDLAAQMGETYEMPSDRAKANRMIFSLTKRLNSREYHAAKGEASSALNDLIGEVSTDDVPFD